MAKRQKSRQKSDARYQELKFMLEERKRKLEENQRLRLGSLSDRHKGPLDTVEQAKSDMQDDLDFALVQMEADALNRTNDALYRLEQGTYGNCFECGVEIPQARLKALPLAIRCRDCADNSEQQEERERQVTRKAAS
jgi:DnaK suppressor protein